MIFLIIFLLMPSMAWAEQKSILELSALADFECMDIKFLGVCPKPNREPPVGIKVRYWQPEVFMETVKHPGDSVIAEYGAILGKTAKKITQIEMKTSTGKAYEVTGGDSRGLNGSNLQFNEVHIYDYPLGSILETALCSDIPNGTLGIRYLTEMDAPQWRKADIEGKLPQSLAAPLLGPQCSKLPLGSAGQCMKSWGPLYPRQGFVTSAIPAVGSIVDGIRSLSIASEGIMTGHIVESRLDFTPNITIDKVQMIYPNRSSCMPIGQHPAELERYLPSKEGHYVWIFWHQRQCCL